MIGILYVNCSVISWNDWHSSCKAFVISRNDWDSGISLNDWHSVISRNDWHSVISRNDWHSRCRLCRLTPEHLIDVVILAHLKEVTHEGLDVAHEAVEVSVGNVPLLAELSDDRSNFVIVDVADSEKEVVLDLVVEAAVQDGQPEAAHVGRGNNLKWKIFFVF